MADKPRGRPPLDYRDLLLRYIAYVVKQEGVHCIPLLGVEGQGYFKTSFNEPEREELQRLANEAVTMTLPEPTDDDYT